MLIISHRGNLNGKVPEYENNPTHIDYAITHGFDVEIDVWYIDGQFFLGHDDPTYIVDDEWILNRSTKLWCHAKNQEALEMMLSMKDVICFWHQEDRMTITSNGILWLYPGNYSKLGVTVVVTDSENIPAYSWGICTDTPMVYKYI